jgi:hypothetical protein
MKEDVMFDLEKIAEEAFIDELQKISSIPLILLGATLGEAAGNLNEHLINKRLKELGENEELKEGIDFEKKHPILSTGINAIPGIIGGLAAYKIGERFHI